MDDLQNSDQSHRAMPSPLISSKKMCLPTLTTSPHLLSFIEQPSLPLPLRACHTDPPMLNLDIQFATGCLTEIQRHPNEDTSSFQTSNRDPSTDHFNSPFLHSCNWPTLQASALGMTDKGQTSDQPIWNAEEASEQIEDDVTINSLFDQYLQPNSFSTTDPTKTMRSDKTLNLPWTFVEVEK